MALYVLVDGGHTIEWHVGEGNLKEKVPSVLYVNAVSADGDELHKIQTELDGIRKAMKNRVVMWRGEDAQFIVENLR